MISRSKALKIFDQNLGLVGKVASKFPASSLYDRNDYFQMGAITLWELIRKNTFDPKKGSFSAFACFAMYRSINKTLQKKEAEKKKEGTYLQPESLFEFLPDNLSPAEQKAIKMLSEGKNLQEITKAIKTSAKKVIVGVMDKTND